MSYPKLEVSPKLTLRVNEQKYAVCSMMTPNCFPITKRHYAPDYEVYGFKLYGVFETEKQQLEYCDKMQKQNKMHNVFPFEIGRIMEFDVDTSELKHTKFVYHEQRLNDSLGDKTFNVDTNENNLHSEVKTSDTEMETKTNDISEMHDQTSKYSLGSYKKSVLHQNFCCVSFFPASCYQKTKPEIIQGRKLVSFIVYGAFDNLDDAQKFTLRNKDKLIFIFEMSKWAAFYHDLLKNCDNSLSETRNQLLNDYMELYEKALKDEGAEEQERKMESLKGANVVTGQFDMLNETSPTNNNFETNETKEGNNEMTNLTEEEKIELELKNLKMEKEKITRIECTEEEFNKKCEEILFKHRELQR